MNPDPNKASILRRIARFLTPLALVAIGTAAWAYFQSTAPRMVKHKPTKSIPVVDVATVEQKDAPIVIQAMGTVVASREVTLKARVSGDVVFLSPQFVPGGHLPKGAQILRLDQADYEVELKKAESALANAKAALAIEQGNQTVAREELRLLAETAGDVVASTDLALRKPQLQQAEATVTSAEADLRKARLDLERTVVTTPFNAMVIERNVNIGSHVNSQENIATIVDTDEFWIEAVVPVDRLKYLDLVNGCPAVIRSQTGQSQREGRAVRATGKVSETSRMAKVIVSVSDPLRRNREDKTDQLVLGDYVTVDIQGRSLKSVIELPRSALREGNNVWVYNDGRLEIHPVTLAWKEGKRVFVDKGLAPGDRVVVSDLSIPVQGMKLELSGAKN